MRYTCVTATKQVMAMFLPSRHVMCDIHTFLCESLAFRNDVLTMPNQCNTEMTRTTYLYRYYDVNFIYDNIWKGKRYRVMIITSLQL